jgi:nucleotide-binding universal stress UspA family protein
MYRVLMPVDTNKERAMAQARYVAGLPGASDSVEVVVLHVFTETGDEDSTEQVDKVDTVTRAVDVLSGHGIEHRTVGVRGRPTAEILDHATELEPDTVALGGRKRSPAGKILFGSVTMEVLRNTDIPVVVAGNAPMGDAGVG